MMLLIAYVVIVLVAVGGSCAVFVARVRVKRLQDALPPHERWPEIVSWQRNDQFSTKGWKYSYIQLICVDSQGWVYCNTDNREKPLQMWRVEQLVGTNINLHQRNRARWIAESEGYMETLDQINKAKLDIQERDRLNGISA